MPVQASAGARSLNRANSPKAKSSESLGAILFRVPLEIPLLVRTRIRHCDASQVMRHHSVREQKSLSE